MMVVTISEEPTVYDTIMMLSVISTSEGTATTVSSDGSLSVGSCSSTPSSALRKGRFSFDSTDSSTSDRNSTHPSSSMSDKCTMKLYDECITKKVKSHNHKLHQEWKAKMKEDEQERGSTVKIIKKTTGSRRRSTVAKDEVDTHGPILSQYSNVAFALHQWKKRYWAKVGPSSIYLFRDKIEFNVWNQSKDSKFVRKEIHFDTVELLRQKSALRKEKGTRIFKYKMGDVTVNHTKKSSKTPLDVCLFKLQINTDVGIFQAAGFSSQDTSQEVEDLRAAMLDCMEACIQKYAKAAHKKKSHEFSAHKKSKNKKEKKSHKSKKEISSVATFASAKTVKSSMATVVSDTSHVS
jgi:hypothetical protein